MSQPTRGDVHVNRPLTNISIAFIQSASKFIANKVFANIPVKKQSDRYFLYTRDQWFTDEMQKRAPSTESAGSGFDIDNTPTYFADVWALHKDISDQIRGNQDQPIDLDRDATTFLTQKGMIKKEKEFALKFFKTGLWTGSTTGADIVPGIKWDAVGSDPVDDIEAEMDAMEELTGFRPNTLVVTPDTHRAFKNNASILDRIKHTQKGTLTEELLAGLFGVSRYMVARATNNLAAEKAAKNMKFIFGTEQALLTYSESSPGILKPSAGYTFSWTGMRGSGAEGNRIKRFRMDALESDRVEIDMAFAQKLVSSDLGVFFNDVLT